MKAIIITESDCVALMNAISLKALQQANMIREADLKDATPEFIANTFHRAFIFVVFNWLKEQGAGVSAPPG